MIIIVQCQWFHPTFPSTSGVQTNNRSIYVCTVLIPSSLFSHLFKLTLGEFLVPDLQQSYRHRLLQVQVVFCVLLSLGLERGVA